MSRLAIAPLLFTAGCLYLGDLNHAPKIDDVTVLSPDTNKGTAITFYVKASDPEDPSELLTLSHTVKSGDGQTLDPNCDYLVNELSYDAFSITFYRTGLFAISTQVTDTELARSMQSTTMLTVTNAPPTFDSMALLKPNQAPLSCNAYTAGNPIPIELTGMVHDPDLTAALCGPGETLSYDWLVSGPPGSHPVITPFVVGAGCTAAGSSTTMLSLPTPDEICIWPDYGTTTIATSYSVKLTVSDGGNAPASLTVDVPVEADNPPCLTGLNPAAGSYVVDPASPPPFETLTVTGVSDDLDPFHSPKLTFAWSLWRESDPSWRTISVSGDSYSPDYSIFGVGEHVRIRVEAIDRTGGLATCDVGQDDCTVASCAAATCDKWKTWDLELR